MNYLFLLDEKGQRITTLVIGIHGTNMDELKEHAKDFNPASLLVGDEEQQQLFLKGKIYKNNTFNDYIPDPPTFEEIKASAKSKAIEEYKKTINEFKNNFDLLTLAGEATEKLTKSFQNKKVVYTNYIKVIEVAKNEEELEQAQKNKDYELKGASNV